MIHVITAANRHLFEDEVLEFRRLDGGRARVRGLGFEAGNAAPRSGVVDDDSVFLLDLAAGRLRAGSRLTPSPGPDVMSGVFPHPTSVGGVPRDPIVYAWTAAHADAPRPDVDQRAAGEMLCAVVEYCLAGGIHGVSAIVEASSLPRFHDMGWSPRPLGLPERVGDDWMLAVLMPLDEAMLEATRAFHGIDEPILVRRDLHTSVTREIGL